MKKNPTVSVILPNYNHAPFLEERIDSILNQTWQDFELILLDDCSTDRSRDILRRYRQHPKVSALLLNERNSGNTFLQWDKGIRQASGRYVWIAESDDSADLRFLEMTVSALDRHPAATMCLTGSLLIDESGRALGRVSRDGWTESEELRDFDGRDYVRHNLFYRNYVYNASMVLFRRDVYDGLDKSFQHLRCAGDWQFWAEVALAGRVLEVRQKLNRFRQHANKVSSRARSTGEGVSDLIEVMAYIQAHVPASPYRRLLARGECYRKIIHSKAPRETRRHLRAKARDFLQANGCDYALAWLNRIAAPVCPLLATPRRDKLK